MGAVVTPQLMMANPHRANRGKEEHEMTKTERINIAQRLTNYTNEANELDRDGIHNTAYEIAVQRAYDLNSLLEDLGYTYTETRDNKGKILIKDIRKISH